MKRNIGLHKDQTGIVSIMVTMIIMIILSLIVLGFARIMRREQRQSLDYQLSTQAFYAAEAGINDAVKAIKADNTIQKNTCGPTPGFPSNILDGSATDGISYSCLLINSTPPELVYDNIDIDRSQVVPMKSVPGDQFTSVTISWQAKTASSAPSVNSCPSTDQFPSMGPPAPAPSWPTSDCDAGVLRVDLVPTSGTLTRDNLAANTFTAFFYPQSAAGGGAVDYATTKGFPGQGKVVGAECSGGSRLCKVTITGLMGNSYHLRLKSIYTPSSVTITASSLSVPTGPAPIVGAQALVDSTGKANDVLRRIQARVPLQAASDYTPGYAVESISDICKRIKTGPGMSPEFDPVSCRP